MSTEALPFGLTPDPILDWLVPGGLWQRSACLGIGLLGRLGSTVAGRCDRCPALPVHHTRERRDGAGILSGLVALGEFKGSRPDLGAVDENFTY
jgi:hypothetical protein